MKKSFEFMSEGKKPVILFPKKVAIILFVAVGLLLVVNLASILYSASLEYETKFSFYLSYYFDFNREHNFPTFFSSFLLLMASGLLAFIYFVEDGSKKERGYWLILSGIFLFLSIDESVQIHEEVTKLVRPLLASDLEGFLHWAWVVPYFIFFLLVAAYFFPFVKNLHPKTRKYFFLSGFLFVFGALGLELFEGYFYKHYGLDHIYNKVLYCLEELLEMSGVIIFIYALLDHLAGYKASICIDRKDSVKNRGHEPEAKLRSEKVF